MSDGVHLLLPFAACQAPACHAIMEQLELPQLHRLVARLAPAAGDEGDQRSLSPPHERALAAACGLSAPDGCIPWAAWQVEQAGRGAGAGAWAWITPCHWQVATDHIVMHSPHSLRLDAGESQALLAAMQPFFAQDGIALEYDAPTRWLAQGELFRGLATASLDRVTGRDIDEWVPRAAAAGALRRLQQEMQMLLYTHATNDERTSRDLQAVNSFWASGSGALPANRQRLQPGLQVPYALRDAALLEDWSAWAGAWQQIDSGPCRQLNQDLDQRRAVTLTLCGEANTRSWSGAETGFWPRIRGVFGRESISRLLKTL